MIIDDDGADAARGRSRLRRLATDPLALFLLLGLAIFAVERWWDARRQTIEVTGDEVARIAELWQAQTGRAATPGELDALLEQHVREEVLFRSAQELGLDRDDVIVRRRLAQKMAFLLEDEGSLSEPDEEELRAHWRAHPERWERSARIAFQHVYWSADERGEAAHEAARAALAELRADDSGWRSRGDPFMLQRELAERTRAEVASLFGDEFAQRLFEVAVGDWHGPLESTFGAHLVRVLSRQEAEQPSLEEVADRVREDLMSRRRAEASESAYRELRERYRVEIEGRGGTRETAADGR